MTNKELLKIAEKHLGEGGSKFRKYCGLPSGAAWCNAYVDYIANEGGVAKLYFEGKKETYCPHSIKWCEKNLAQLPLYLSQPMDIIYFDWEKNGIPNHIGFVRARNTSSSIYTIEGNTGNKVQNKTRPKKYVQGIFRPLFPPPKKQKKGKLTIDGDFSWHSVYMLQVALGIDPTGIFTKATVQALQKKVGATPDGAFGPATAKAVQKWIGATQDGDFGEKSTKALQKKINDIVYPSSQEMPSEPTTEPSDGKGYTGKFPEPNNNVKLTNSLAYSLCYPYGTPKKKYMYSTGKPRPEYKKAIDKAYPNHKEWKNKKQKVGACCDIFPGTVMNLLGVPMPKHLKDQTKAIPKAKNLKQNGHHTKGSYKMGDIVNRLKKNQHGHTWIVFEDIHGTRYIANAHYRKLNGCYAVMDAKPKDVNPKKYAYYYCFTIDGAIRTDYRKEDYGYDVLYIQKFLNWYGTGIKLTEDGYFGDKTREAVERFQKAEKLTIDGHVGAKTIEKMKGIRK